MAGTDSLCESRCQKCGGEMSGVEFCPDGNCPHAEQSSLFSYRYYAWLAPGTQEPSVWCGDIDGPNVYRVRNCRWVWQARIYAWWLNRKRVPLDPAKVAANRGGDRMDTWADVG